MNLAVISIGSNIQPERHVPAAMAELCRRHRVLAQSKVMPTKAIGRDGQVDPSGADFLNACVLIETPLDLAGLRQALGELELHLGRVRTADKFAPRTIDLDVVVWNGQVVDADFHRRPFLRDLVRQVLPNGYV